jgi:hypothetical protein
MTFAAGRNSGVIPRQKGYTARFPLSSAGHTRRSLTFSNSFASFARARWARRCSTAFYPLRRLPRRSRLGPCKGGPHAHLPLESQRFRRLVGRTRVVRLLCHDRTGGGRVPLARGQMVRSEPAANLWSAADRGRLQAALSPSRKSCASSASTCAATARATRITDRQSRIAVAQQSPKNSCIYSFANCSNL